MFRWLTQWIRRPQRARAVVAARRLPTGPATRAPRVTAATLAALGPPAGAAALPADDKVLIAMLDLPIAIGPDRAEVSEVEARIRGMVYDGKLKVPAFPAAAARVFEMVEKPDLDVNELIRVLHLDPAVVAEIVVAANSAMYAGSGAPLDDLRSAVLTLGLQQVGAIAAAVSARALFELQERAEYELFPTLWQAAHAESLVVAFTSSSLAQALRLPRYDRVFLRAVISGVGRTLALRALARQLIDGRCGQMPSLQVIAAAVDTMHREAATMAIAGWSLPASVTLAVDPTNETEKSIVDLVSTLVELRRDPTHLEAAARARVHAQWLGLDAIWLRVILRECSEYAVRVAELVSSTPRPRAH